MASAAPSPAWCSIAVRGLIEGPRTPGVVAAAGKHAAYVAFDPGVIALLSVAAVRLPIGVHVATLPQLQVGDLAWVGAGQVAVGVESWRAARWWNPRPALDPATLRTVGGALSAHIVGRTGITFGVDLDEAAEAAHDLARGAPARAIALLGRGPGFTPAGDDVVAGALAALALAATLDSRAASSIIAAAAERTTTISAELLRCAARGEVVPPAARLLIAACRHAPDLEPATAALVAVGGTSGAALALGLASALTALRPSEMGTR